MKAPWDTGGSLGEARRLVMACLLGSVWLGPSPVVGQASAWVVDPRPLLELGAGSDERDQFGLVVHAVRTRDGDIAVLDAFLPGVRVYDSSGRHLRDIGRAGDGPGEFREPSALVVRGDTLAVLDQRGSLTLVDVGGVVLRTERLAIEPYCGGDHNARFGGLLPDATVILRCEERLFGRVRGEYRQEVGLLRVRAPRQVDTLGWFPADSGRTDAGSVPVPRPYSPQTGLLWSAAGNRVFVASPASATVQSFDLAGGSRVLLSPPVTARRVTQEDVDEENAAALRFVGNANDRRVVAEWSTGKPRAKITPAIRSIVAATEGEVWVETWERDSGGSLWIVMDTGDRVVARVVAPPGSQLLAVGLDWTLWLWRDEFGVDRVRLHRLVRDLPEEGTAWVGGTI